ncbi:hypothetical protein SSX86_027147 [Deinandra increscens subsp. villosa]|uniref:F-box domain-containing protein n=1 Tax=Deinandra increscens subsp. villosa TaxID=3103831 RepID=A0AAP0CLA8_9ASTR
MAADVPFDVIEQILVGLNAKDLIRCKSVCKSWRSLISSSRFVKAHMKHDRENVGYRRIGRHHLPGYDRSNFYCNFMCVVGSCNGLVCVSPKDVELEVINPWTREIKKLPKPPLSDGTYGIRKVLVTLGFGYDASTDDYKVIAGFRNKERTSFYVLSLKPPNVWKLIGEVNYRYFWNPCGILCGGALHWFMSARNKKKVIMSIDLSTEEWKEISQPAEPEYECGTVYEHKLGVIEECLCIYSPESWKIWVMKNKWELYNANDQGKYDVAHSLIYNHEVVDSQNHSRYVYVHDDGRLVPICSCWGS